MPVIGRTKIGGYPELAQVLNTYRKQPDTATFFFFGGNSLAPSPLSSLDRGTHIIDLLNSLEPDAMGVTKREFSYFEDELSLRAYEAVFPIVASNISDKRSKTNIDAIVDSIIVEQRGIKIGMMSVIDKTAITDYSLKNIVVLDPQKAIEKNATELRQQGADLIVLLYSTNFIFIDQLLDDKIINMSFTTSLDSATLASETKPTHPNAVMVTKSGQVAIMHTTKTEQQTQTSTSWQTVELSKYAKDPAIRNQVDEYSARLNRLMDEHAGVVTKYFTTLRSSVRTEQNAFANMLTDTLREFSHADIALINGGAIRGNKQYLLGQQLTHRDIAQELPFRSRVALLNISGAQLIEALENGFSMIETIRGRFPHVSGMEVTYDPHAPVNKRVKSVLINGQPLENKRIYKLATSDYLSSGGDGYTVLEKCPKIVLGFMLNPLIVDVFVDHLRQLDDVKPTLDARLVNIHE
ncbi:MAG: 5'-nucleotidase/UDP-sugar diphosphatase [Paraglaciecola sp.]|jgi:5'-nucleotidase/UDP-sugar diphosphatase